MRYSIKSVLEVAQVSRQAVHKHCRAQMVFDEKLSGLITEVDILREEHPGCGVEKMYYTLRPDWLGRDKFISIFMELGYRLKTKKNYQKTTIPVHSKYKNLIQGMMVQDRNIVWQTDITYFLIGDRYYYLVFIIDVYTKVILGFQASNHLRAEANQAALKMAINNSNGNLNWLIHHSDKGGQYIDKNYIALLERYGISISMGASAQDNAYAERINGTIKNEYLNRWQPRNLKELKSMLKRAVSHYNNKRIHNELPGKTTPVQFEKSLLDLTSQKRPTVIIYAEGNYKIKVASSHFDFKPKEGTPAHNCPIEIY
jgi:transposase InsO family protein